MPLVLQNTITRSSFSCRMMRAIAATLSVCSTVTAYWRMSGLFCSSARTVISSGSRW